MEAIEDSYEGSISLPVDSFRYIEPGHHYGAKGKKHAVADIYI